MLVAEKKRRGEGGEEGWQSLGVDCTVTNWCSNSRRSRVLSAVPPRPSSWCWVADRSAASYWRPGIAQQRHGHTACPTTKCPAARGGGRRRARAKRRRGLHPLGRQQLTAHSLAAKVRRCGTERRAHSTAVCTDLQGLAGEVEPVGRGRELGGGVQEAEGERELGRRPDQLQPAHSTPQPNFPRLCESTADQQNGGASPAVLSTAVPAGGFAMAEGCSYEAAVCSCVRQTAPGSSRSASRSSCSVAAVAHSSFAGGKGLF